MFRSAAAAIAAMLGCVAGCGGPGKRVQGPTDVVSGRTGPAPAPGALAGTWTWQHSSASADGDVVLVSERWSLSHTGSRVTGHYDRVVTMSSGDGRLFECNRGDSYTRRTRVWLEGEATAGQVTLTEKRFEVAPSLCEDGERRLGTYRGQLGGAGLSLTRGEGQQLLARAAGTLPALPDWKTLTRAPTAQDLAGIWRSVTTGRDETGRLRSEYEIWHLEADGSDLTGYYDHVVTVSAAAGHRFACSGGEEYTLRTRYRVAGFFEAATSRVFVNETSYETVPSPCENNQRRLERYEGRFAGGELLLGWGGGGQLLVRPEATRSEM